MRSQRRTTLSVVAGLLALVAAAMSWELKPGNQLDDESGVIRLAITACALGAVALIGGSLSTASRPRRGAAAVILGLCAIGCAAGAAMSLYWLPVGN